MGKMEVVSEKIESKNKALVLEAFDTLFNKRDYAAAERFWSPDYIQHSAHIEPGRDGLFNLIKGIPPTLKYEPGMIVAEGDLVIVHGRFSGFGAPVNWIAADIVRIQNGILVEHWDVIQDEAMEEQSIKLNGASIRFCSCISSKQDEFGSVAATLRKMRNVEFSGRIIGTLIRHGCRDKKFAAFVRPRMPIADIEPEVVTRITPLNSA